MLDGEPPRSGHLARFVPLVLVGPIASSVVGIDGGAMFQIVASENLGMSASAIGLAFGLGVLSVPVQLWAARIPLRRAQRNLRLFVAVLVALCVGMAALVIAGPFAGVTVIAIAIAVTAEIALSVLYATSWLPLQTVHLNSVERQRLASQLSGVGEAALAGMLVVFAAVGDAPRAIIIAIVAAALVAITWQLRTVPAVEKPASTDQPGGDGRRGLNRKTALVLACVAALSLAAWPLFLVYVAKVLWPSANLGVVGALQIAGGLVTAMLWRPAVGGLVRRAQVATALLLVSSAALLAVSAPVDTIAVGWVVLAATVVSAGAFVALSLTIIEMVHRDVEAASSVRVFTVLDVVASTSLQVGLLIGGLLVSLSIDTGRFVDPYRGYLVVTATIALALVAVLGRTAPPAAARGQLDSSRDG